MMEELRQDWRNEGKNVWGIEKAEEINEGGREGWKKEWMRKIKVKE